MTNIQVMELRCEYKCNPIGIAVQKPRLSWIISSNERNVKQSAYQIQVSINEASFMTPIWDSGKVESDRSIHVEYEGNKLSSCTRYFYRVRIWVGRDNASEWSETAYWETGLLNALEWKAAWITPNFNENLGKSEICPLLRNTFTISGRVKAARIYVTALGMYELQLNGTRVGDALLTPGWTSYNKRLQYQTYDVTTLLSNGKNAIGAILGAGWYSGNLVWNDKKNLYGDTEALLLQMHITYEDGNEQIILSDNSWKSSSSPILMSQIYHGETYDARLEKPDWSKADCDDSNWNGVKLLEKAKDILVAQENEPVEKIQEIKPISMFTTPKGEIVIDMGQNMVGWVRFSVKGAAGSKVILKHAEVLDSEGNFYTANLRAARQTIEYTLKGSGTECFEPHFTFQGFRYIMIEEYPGEPSIDNFTGIVIHSAMEPIGSFECSNPMLNQLQHNIQWGQKGNFVDVPTDCPQRDERLGWTGDAQVFVRTACYNMNTASFFTKWLKDFKADQTADGGIPFVIPHVLGENDHSSSAWGDAAVICPWTIYLCYGDVSILENQYESMKAWVEYIRSQGDNEFLWNTGFHYGDWLGLDAKENSYVGATACDFIATAYFAYSTSIVAKTAKILGYSEDTEKYEKLHSSIIKAFRKEFVTPGGRLSVPTQTAHVLALMFELVEEKDKKRTVDTLVKYLEDEKMHLTTGFVGTPYLCHVLSQNGRLDEAYKLLLQTDYPSWLYPIEKGATTIWEHWDGIKQDGSFWDTAMNSFNHYAYGAIGDWMYQVAAGIRIDESNPGYKHIIIKPQPGGSLNYVKAQYKSVYGYVVSDWSMQDGKMILNVTIPHNTTATVILPNARQDSLAEGGKIFTNMDGLHGYTETAEGMKLELGSGTYSFTYYL